MSRFTQDGLPQELSLRELVAAVGRYVDGMRIVPTDGRAARLPDARSIRYYISLGLVDRPVGYRGNAALYGRRHVLQLLTIKTLQSQGLGLPDIQRRLLGRDDAWLAAQLPPIRPTPPPPPVAPVAPLPPRRSTARARWTLELPLADGVEVRIDPAAVAQLDPRQVAAALEQALLDIIASVPQEDS